MSRITNRLAATVGLAAVGIVALAGPAAAHTGGEAEAASAGRTRITLTAEVECAGGADPTSGLRVQLPEGATDVQPETQAGWTSETTATEVDWSAAAPTIDQNTFVVEMVLAQPVGETVYLPTIQTCPNGEEIAWIQVPTSPDETLDRPAPSIVVPANTTSATTTAAAEAPTTADSGPTTTARMAIEETAITPEGSKASTSGLVVFIVVTLVILGGAVILYLRHRNTGNHSTP